MTSAGIEQKVSSSNLPGLLHLVLLLSDRDFMQHFYSPKFNFTTLLQSMGSDKGKSNLHGHLR